MGKLEFSIGHWGADSSRALCAHDRLAQRFLGSWHSSFPANRMWIDGGAEGMGVNVLILLLKALILSSTFLSKRITIPKQLLSSSFTWSPCSLSIPLFGAHSSRWHKLQREYSKSGCGESIGQCLTWPICWFPPSWSRKSGMRSYPISSYGLILWTYGLIPINNWLNWSIIYNLWNRYRIIVAENRLAVAKG